MVSLLYVQIILGPESVTVRPAHVEQPPQRIPPGIPACGGLYDCPYEQFKSFINAHVRPGLHLHAAPRALKGPQHYRRLR